MRVMGASADMADVVVEALEAATHAKRAALVWCDGADLVGIFADHGDSVDDLLRVAPKVVPLDLRR